VRQREEREAHIQSDLEFIQDEILMVYNLLNKVDGVASIEDNLVTAFSHQAGSQGL